jgi:hypothetical protein
MPSSGDNITVEALRSNVFLTSYLGAGCSNVIRRQAIHVVTRSHCIVFCVYFSCAQVSLTECEVKILYCSPLKRAALTLTVVALAQASPLDVYDQQSMYSS